MTDCCQAKEGELDALRARYAGVLWVVLGLNAAMFVVEGAAGLWAGSTALLADAGDMLGDTLVYGTSLAVAHRGVRAQGGAALLKALLMLAFAALVVGEIAARVWTRAVPHAPAMGAVGTLALAANLTCAALLLRFRGGDVDMRSTWLCSRNDVLANLGVLAAAAGVALTGTLWPDVLVGGAIAALFVHSAVTVLRAALPQTLRRVCGCPGGLRLWLRGRLGPCAGCAKASPATS